MRYVVDENLSLRLADTALAEALFEQVDQHRDQLYPWMRWTQAIREPADMHELIAGWVREREAEGTQQWVVEVDHQPAGAVYQVRPHALDRHVELGYWLSPWARGRGVVTRSLRLLIDHTFRDMGFHRVYLRIAPHNLASLAIAKRLGFVEEGRTRHAWLVDEQWWDAVNFGLLADEWEVTSPPVAFEPIAHNPGTEAADEPIK